MKVTVEYLGHIKRIIGVEQTEKIELKDDALVADLLFLLAEKHGESFRKAIYEPSGLDLKSNFILTVNGLLLNQLNGNRNQTQRRRPRSFNAHRQRRIRTAKTLNHKTIKFWSIGEINEKNGGS